MKSSIVYIFVWPGCSSCCVGKTERTFEGTKELASHKYLPTCCHYYHIVDNLFSVNNHDIYNQKFIICQIRDNTFVIGKTNNSSINDHQ